MFDGVTYVDPTHNPIIHEGRDSATVVVMNAGPFAVRLKAWPETKPSGEPEVEMQVWPGNTRSISGSLIRAHIDVRMPYLSPPYPPPGPYGPFAALGWRVVK
jgi:hypothetical protein